jgi:hypothetical protein
MKKRRLSFWQIWNMSFGFSGDPIRLESPDVQHERDL